MYHTSTHLAMARERHADLLREVRTHELASHARATKERTRLSRRVFAFLPRPRVRATKPATKPALHGAT
jgi:hypothetical protein